MPCYARERAYARMLCSWQRGSCALRDMQRIFYCFLRLLFAILFAFDLQDADATDAAAFTLY